MNKAHGRRVDSDADTMRAEYDFSKGVRGKYYRAMQASYTITIRRKDGSKVVKEVKPSVGTVVLDPDVFKCFPDSQAVNYALRSLIKLIPTRRTTVTAGCRLRNQ